MFLQNVVTAGTQVLILYMIVAVGFICDKTKLYTEKASRLTNDLLFYIVTPAIIIESFTSIEYSKENLINLMWAFFGGTLIHLIGIVISLPLFRKGEKISSVVYRFACVYGNTGYMALPLAGAVLGPQGVFFCAGVIIPFNIFAFTHGVFLMSSDSDKGRTKFNLKSLILNPGVISVVIGLPLFLLKITLPKILAEPVSYIASINTPMAMLMFGTYLAKTNLKTMFLRKQTYLVALIKLLIVPAVTFLVLRLFGISGTLLCALMISAAAPSANNTVMFATKYNKDTAAASQTVAIVSFISIITMPIMIAMAQSI
ncbi:MAG: AEC family transporter [Oscillospiraceae bacterium]